MGHHLDSPLAREDVRLDITDLFAFRGETGTVFVMDVNSSLSGEDAREGFHPEARYEFKIDVDRDAVEDITYRVRFGEPDDTGRQPVELRRLTGRDARDTVVAGALLARGATESEVTGEGGLRMWAGQANDPFYLEPRVLEAVRNAVTDGGEVDVGSWRPDQAVDAFADASVYSIVLEVADGDLTELIDPSGRVRIWGTTSVPSGIGTWRQINRAGLPMVQAIFNADDSERASAYNTTQPAEDKENYGALFAELVAKLVARNSTAQDPQAYGEMLAETLLPDMLPYQIGSPANFGFLDRNGRTLTDNVPEVMYSMVINSALPQGLTREHAAETANYRFPYLTTTAHCAIHSNGDSRGWIY